MNFTLKSVSQTTEYSDTTSADAEDGSSPSGTTFESSREYSLTDGDEVIGNVSLVSYPSGSLSINVWNKSVSVESLEAALSSLTPA